MTCALMTMAPVGWKPCMPGCDPKTCHDCTDQRMRNEQEQHDQPTFEPFAALHGRQSTP
jgi:hypothetical protein